jgi:hypothetical protein
LSRTGRDFPVTRSGSWRTLPARERSDGKLRRVIQAWIEEVALPCISRFATSAFQYVTEPQPVRVEVDAGEAEGRRNERGGRLAVGSDGLPSMSSWASNFRVPNQAPRGRRPDRSSDRPDSTGRRRAARWASAMIAPTFRSRAAQPSRRCRCLAQGVVHRRVAQRAGDPDRLEARAIVAEESTHADDGIELQQCQGRRGSVRSTSPQRSARRNAGGSAATST